MSIDTTMCEFRGLKQHAFEEACCAFSVSENMEGIARQLDMSGTMLRNKLNPNQPHILSPVELIAISKISGNYTILNSLILGLGMVTVQLPIGETEESLLTRALQNSIHAGELSQTALDLGGGSRLTRTQRHGTIAKCQAAIGNLVLLINDLESRTSGVTPFLSMSVDFVMNGAPMPGLS